MVSPAVDLFCDMPTAPVSSRPHPLGDAGGAVPITFGPVEALCAGWFHPCRTRTRGVGVVICQPVGYEGNCAHDTCRELAESLALSGFAVVRFDYHGTGNSAGGDTDSSRVQAWLDSLTRAIAEVKRRGFVSTVSLVGIRLGATLATQLASEQGNVESLVLWAPCPSGRVFARELRAAAFGRNEGSDRGTTDGIEAMGYLYTADTLRDLNRLDLLCLRAPPAKRALIIGRDDLPGEGPVPRALRNAGVETVFRDLGGYAAMMVEPHREDVARGTLAAITEWLVGAHPRASSPRRESASAPVERAQLLVGGVREVPVVFGANRTLFGVLSEPENGPAPGPQRTMAVLMLSVATNHHVGPNRMYVKMARTLAARGYRSLRFDLAGIGDSRAEEPLSAPRVYSRAAVNDVKSAMDYLSGRGCEEFVLVGLCSGAYVAFQTALADPRVSAQVLMNPRRLTWRAGDTLESVMQESYKSTVFYRRALLEPLTYLRLLRGEIDARGIANRLRLLGMARLRRAGRRLLRQAPAEEDILSNLQHLCARGQGALFIVGADDDGRDYVEYHLGPRGRYLSSEPNFQMAFIDGADHTFSPAKSLRKATQSMVEFLDRRYAPTFAQAETSQATPVPPVEVDSRSAMTARLASETRKSATRIESRILRACRAARSRISGAWGERAAVSASEQSIRVSRPYSEP